MTEAYTRMYIVVPDIDAEEVSALGAIRITAENIKEHRMLRRTRLKPGKSVWCYVNKDPNLFVKWPCITFEVIPGQDEITEEDEFMSKDVTPLLDDDDPFGAIAERELIDIDAQNFLVSHQKK